MYIIISNKMFDYQSQAHPLAMVELVREYSVASSNAPIADAEIHGLLVHALVGIQIGKS